MEKILQHNHDYYAYRQSGGNIMHTLGPIGIIPLTGAQSFAEKVNAHLYERRLQYYEDNLFPIHDDPGFMRSNYFIDVECIRFSSGEAKGVINSSVRGHDIYIFCDVTNYSCTYRMFGHEVPMGPDDHYQDLKRIILATCGKARRINVIMPFLYEGRQDSRNSRESLDCSFMLNSLKNLGVENIITFDPHDPRVENAIPQYSLDHFPSTFPLVKALLTNEKDIRLSGGKGSLVIISPDETALKRASYLASLASVPLGTFYRQRDYSQLVDGRNPIMSFEYLGDDVAGHDVVIVDDMIDSGSTFIETARQLKARHARRIFVLCTFGLFTSGLDDICDAWENGIIDRIYTTNLSYKSPEVLAAPWHVTVDLSKDVALLIDALNHDASTAALADHTDALREFIYSYKQQTALVDQASE